MATKVYGRELLEFIARRHDVTAEFDYFDLDQHAQAQIINHFTALATSEMLAECLLGEGCFGPLAAEFLNSRAAYIMALDTRMSNAARKGATPDDLADMLGCQELTNAESKTKFGHDLFQVFCKSNDVFYELANEYVNHYMTRQLISQIEDALQPFLEARADYMRSITEDAA